MNLINKKWICTGSLKSYCKDGNLIIENNANNNSFLIFPKLFKSSNQEIFLKVVGTLLEGTGCTLRIINRHKQVLGSCGLNSVYSNKLKRLKYFILALYVPAFSKIEINEISYSDKFDFSVFDEHFENDTLLITPGYPSLENKYNSAFVHTRIKAYQRAGIGVDVIVCNELPDVKMYEYEGVNVFKCDYYILREILKVKNYKKILIHFFDNRYANVLESIDTSEIQLYFFLHGAETLYRDWPKIVSPYFDGEAKIDDHWRDVFDIKDFYIKKYNELENVKWLFVTEWTKLRCEELLNIKFNNYDIVPCLIDTDLFKYEKKDTELRKKIFVLRKFDDINSYSLDTVVRIILELSRRPFFYDLQFDIYGDGSMHDRILEPVKDFKNVNIYKKFLTHDEIRKVHETHGIALFPTRFDSQAVSSCEAAASGCAVITSDIPGVRQFIPHDLGVMCKTEDYKQYADVIEKMYYDAEFFLKVGKDESASVSSKFDYQHTIQKELDIYNKDYNTKKSNITVADNPILSVIVPSYNVEQYLKHTVFSIVDQKNAGKLEVIIVNDGSRDKTAQIAEELVNKYSFDGKSIIRVINKANGGHGSTINVGIEEARGKYVKIIDGDDTVDSEEFAKLIDVLEYENSDIILNNFMEDFAKDNELVVQKIYNHLKPTIQYHFDDLCYEDYGFTSWGPILSCSSYKTEMLKKGNFKLSEKTFYVDMELNTYVALLCDTITYYNLNIYRYLLGRDGQSVARQSYTRNYKHHENVCINIIDIYYKNFENLSLQKRNYILNHIILPMVSTQYEICINYRNDTKPFRTFNKRLKAYPVIYNNNQIKIKNVIFHRITGGYLIFMSKLFITFNSLLHIFIRPFKRIIAKVI
ncbi:MAG: glycosyltransferase [Acutalibacteraceae bacterium]|nr:glycosyltransferase [Acutalibacteraceae bacterium]